jgi:hypothetical protein
MENLTNNIALYAAVKTFHGSGHDMWSAVASLTLLIMPDSGTDEEVKTSFTDQYRLEVPMDALRTTLARLKREGYIEHSNSYARLTPKGQKYRAQLEHSLSKVRREYKSLTEDFQKYLSSKKMAIPSQLDSALLDFIDDNIGFASDVVTSTSKRKAKTSIVPASAIADYIINIEGNSPQLFEILQNIFFGRLYLTLVKTRTSLDTKAKFDKLTVYLDTNILLSLFDFHDEDTGKSAKEMLGVFKDYSEDINIAVFDATITEAIHLFDTIASDDTPFTDSIKVDSVQYRVRSRHIDKHDLALLMENFEDKVKELGIDIQATPAIDEEKLQDTRSAINKAVALLEGEKHAGALGHDATLIESIKIKRGKSRSQLLEKSKAIFVTPDLSVISYAREASNIHHAFPLAIRPIDIISLLWVKAIGREKSKFSGSLLRHAVMGYARERLISNNLWESFVTRLEEAQKKGQITKDDIGIILAADETEKLLLSDKGHAVKKIVNPDFVQKIRKEQDDLKQKSQSDAKTVQFLSQELREKTTQVTTISGEKDALKEAREQADSTLSAIDATLSTFSRRASKTMIGVAALIIATLFAIASYWLFISIGADRLASFATLIVIVVAVLMAIIFGKEVKPIVAIVTLRKKLVLGLENAIFNFIRNRLLIRRQDAQEKE